MLEIDEERDSNDYRDIENMKVSNSSIKIDSKYEIKQPDLINNSYQLEKNQKKIKKINDNKDSEASPIIYNEFDKENSMENKNLIVNSHIKESPDQYNEEEEHYEEQQEMERYDVIKIDLV